MLVTWETMCARASRFETRTNRWTRVRWPRCVLPAGAYALRRLRA